MQEFTYTSNYDCVWVQWAALYLTDRDLLLFLKATASHLEKTDDGRSGLLFVKENVCPGQFLVDTQDHSVMRTCEQFEALFEAAGLVVVSQSF